MKTILITLSIACLLSGCGVFENRTRPEAFIFPEPSLGMGTIIISTGAAERCFNFSTSLGFFEAKSRYASWFLKASISVDTYTLKSDFVDHHGFLHAISLPAGAYYMAPMLVNPGYEPKSIPRADFTINAGEVAYFGEYFMPSACSSSASSFFRDRGERDIPLLEKRNYSLAKTVNRKFIPVFTGFAVSR
jgi:hypothetical protein